jgi:hypothetical protein
VKSLNIIRAGILFVFALFCVYGFLASFEGGVNPAWKVGYAATGIAAAAGGFWLLFRK